MISIELTPAQALALQTLLYTADLHSSARQTNYSYSVKELEEKLAPIAGQLDEGLKLHFTFAE